MADEKVTRRLAAIFAADMVGYSRLMEADEEGTIARQKAHRKELIEPKIAEHDGRIVKTTGDGMLVEFASVVDAVRCAVKVQQSMAEREADVPDDRRISYRIGINLGDIVIEDDDVMGDGVNVAARLEALAKPGEVLISGTAFDQLKKKLEYGYHFRGERKVKNITEPVRIYAVLPDTEAGTVLGRQRVSPKIRGWISGAAAAVLLLVGAGLAWWQPWVARIEPARLDKMAFPLPDKPSIAVLPFNNLSGDKDQEYFADGMTDDLITALSKVSGLIVISRTSAFTFKGRNTKIKDIARILGVRYVLEGSVRRAQGKVRINAQLIDATTGGHVWAETFDRDYKHIFALQDEVKGKIVQALKVKLSAEERKQLKRRPTKNLEAYDLYLKAEKLRLTFNGYKYRAAFILYDKALALDPDFLDAHVGNAKASFRAWRVGYSQAIFPPKAKLRAQNSLARILALDPDNAEAAALQAGMQLYLQKHDLALALARSAVARHPRNATLQSGLARVLLASDRLEEARAALKRAEALAPKPSPDLLIDLARDYLMLGEAKPAVDHLVHARNTGGSRFVTALLLANAYARLGNMRKASVEWKIARKFLPWLSVSWFRVSDDNYRNKRLRDEYFKAYLKAGMPEWPYGFRGRAEHRLRNAELRALYFGRPSKTISTSPSGSFEEYLNDGKGNWTGKLRTGGTEIQYDGKTTIEGDKQCYRTAAYMIGRKICGEFYRNPEGSPETNNEYIRINMFGKKFFSFKPVAEK